MNKILTRTVYLISSSKTDKVYIGSTSDTLKRRLSHHRRTIGCTSSEIILLGDYKISPLCVIEKCTRKEIELKESDFIFFLRDICVNKTFTKNSKTKEYRGPYIFDGRRKEWSTTKFVCEICDGKYTNTHKARHLKSKNHLSFL